MVTSYTKKLGYSIPDVNDTERHWYSDWYRNQAINEAISRNLTNGFRVYDGGEISIISDLGISVSEITYNINGFLSTYGRVPSLSLTPATVNEEYKTNWIVLRRITGETYGVRVDTVLFSTDFAIGYVDCDQTSILRFFDLRVISNKYFEVPEYINFVYDNISSDNVSGGYYDTTNDLDGGLWREKTSFHRWDFGLDVSSEYEKRKFPEKVFYVFDGSFYIYDATNQDSIVFAKSVNTYSGTPKSIHMSNGCLIISWLETFTIVYDFANDTTRQINHSDLLITNVNDSKVVGLTTTKVSEKSGLPYPTFLFATDQGATLIDGPAGLDIMTKSLDSLPVSTIDIDKNEKLFWTLVNDNRVLFTSNYSTDNFSSENYSESSIPAILSGVGITASSVNGNIKLFGTNNGLIQLKENVTKSNGMVNFIGGDYQSGWQYGDSSFAIMASSKEGILGLDTETNLLVNPDFSDGTITGWTVGNNAEITIVNEPYKAVNIAYTDTNDPYIFQVVPTKIGIRYRFYVPYLSTFTYGDGLIKIGTSLNGEYFNTNDYPGMFIKDIEFIAETEETFIIIGSKGNSSSAFDYLELKPSTSVVKNGFFESDNLYWISEDGGWSVYNKSLNVYYPGYLTKVKQEGILIPGRRYHIKSFLRVTAGSIVFSLGTTKGVVINSGVAFTHEEEILSNGTDLWIETLTISSSIHIQSIEITDLDADQDESGPLLVDVDFSVNSQNFNVVGEVNKEPIFPGSDTMAYSNLSLYNYLTQDHNNKLNFGTGKFYICFWAYWLEGESGTVVNRGNELDTSVYPFYIVDINKLEGYKFRIYFHNGSAYTSIVAEKPLVEGWNFFLVTRDDVGNIKMYNNEVLVKTGSCTYNLDRVNANTYCGHYCSTNFKISRLRAGKGNPSYDDARFIYEQEKRLFRQDSISTLSANKINKIKHDLKTNLSAIIVENDTGDSTIDTLQNSTILRGKFSAEEDKLVDYGFSRDNSISINQKSIITSGKRINLGENLKTFLI